MKRTLTLFTIGMLLISTLARAESPSWNRVGVTPELGRASMGMVYDSNRQVLVMFGGRNGPTFLGDTAEFDGSAWKTVATAHAPSPRFWIGMAYDSDRKRVVLFGGGHDLQDEEGNWNGVINFDDTWEYDGSDWTQIKPAHSPSPRWATSMVYDSCRKRSILFSGYGASNDTWEYDGSDWTQSFTATSPAPRALAGMAFDSQRCKTVLFGGCCGIENSEATWEYDGVNWAKVETKSSPFYFWAHAMTYDAARQRTVLFGGYSPSLNSVVNDTWEYDGEARTWTKMFPSGSPWPVEQHAMAYDSHRKRVMMVEGSETWEYTVTASPPSGQLFATGDRVVITMLEETASFSSELWLLQPGGPKFLARNSDVGKVIVELGALPAGSELVFGLKVTDTSPWPIRPPGDVFFTGPASRNPDNVPHARTEFVVPGVARVGFEDLFGGGDFNYMDCVFTVSGVTAEPFRTLEISAIPDQCLPPGQPSPVLFFTLAAPTPENVALTVFSLDPAIVPTENIFLGGGGADRMLVFIPKQAGQTVICVSAHDPGNATGLESFIVNASAICDQGVKLSCAGSTVVCNDPHLCGARVEYPMPQCAGACQEVRIHCEPPPGYFPVGSTKVVCRAETFTGAILAQCDFQVAVRDCEPPQLTCLGDVTLCADPGACTVYAPVGPSAQDNCRLSGDPKCSFVTKVFPIGTTAVRCTVADTAGNETTCAFTVTVVDCEPPVVHCRPGPNPAGTIPSAGRDLANNNPDGFYQLTATDLCSPDPDIFIGDTASPFQAGPFHHLDLVKLVKAPGAKPAIKPIGNGTIPMITLKGDATVWGRDTSGNRSSPEIRQLPPGSP